jgi:hypothetical protein
VHSFPGDDPPYPPGPGRPRDPHRELLHWDPHQAVRVLGPTGDSSPGPRRSPSPGTSPLVRISGTRAHSIVGGPASGMSGARVPQAPLNRHASPVRSRGQVADREAKAAARLPLRAGLPMGFMCPEERLRFTWSSPCSHFCLNLRLCI